jgi:hypothetical protein
LKEKYKHVLLSNTSYITTNKNTITTSSSSNSKDVLLLNEKEEEEDKLIMILTCYEMLSNYLNHIDMSQCTSNYLSNSSHIIPLLIEHIGIDVFHMKIKECIEVVNENNYVMLIDDQYKLENKYPNKWDEGGFSPSAYHIGKGKTFVDIYEFEDTFESEIIKIHNF